VPLIVLDPLPDIVNPKLLLPIADPLAGLIVNAPELFHIVDALPSVIVPPHTFIPPLLYNDPLFVTPLIVNDSSPTLILLLKYNDPLLATTVPNPLVVLFLPNELLLVIDNIPRVIVVNPLYVFTPLNVNTVFVFNKLTFKFITPPPSCIIPAYVLLNADPDA